MTGWQRWRTIGLALMFATAGLVAAPIGVGRAADRAPAGEQVQLAVPVEPTVRQARGGRWIDVSLGGPTVVTAYEGSVPVYRAYAIRGRQGFETPTGTFYIQHRVANERMAGPGYDYSNVLFTQYFAAGGYALHYNWWSSNWGGAGSRGCLGMSYADAAFFWDWATVGTPVVIHY